MNNMISVDNKLFGFIISIYNGYYPNSGIKEVYRWEGFRLKQLTKWKWYFEYRYALLRIKYPKNHILKGSYDYDAPADIQLINLKNRITAKKRKISEINNKLQLAIDNWNELFPIEENELFIKAVDKLKRLNNELQQLQTSLY